jgi:hypothetical protein
MCFVSFNCLRLNRTPFWFQIPLIKILSRSFLNCVIWHNYEIILHWTTLPKLFLSFFLCSQNWQSSKSQFNQIWLSTKYEKLIIKHPYIYFCYLLQPCKTNMVIFFQKHLGIHNWKHFQVLQKKGGKKKEKKERLPLTY